MAEYRSFVISFNGQKRFMSKISPCSAAGEGEQCPCALLALANCQLLRYKGDDYSYPGKVYAKHTDIRNSIIRTSYKVLDKMKDQGTRSDDEVKHLKVEFLKFMNHMPFEPISTGVGDFGPPAIKDLFGCLHVYVVHGHVDDPEAGQGAFEAQLTSYRLTCLQDHLKEGQPCILYMNGHYDVVLKQYNTLFTLETDEVLLDALPQAIWRRLTVDHADSFYVTSRFSPTEGHRNMEKAEQWYHQNLEEVQLLNEATTDIDQDNSTSDMGANSPCPAEKQKEDLLAHLPIVVSRNESHPVPIADQFLKFLLEFKDGHPKPYFEGIIEAIRYQKFPKAYVPYELIEQYDKKLAIAIRDQSPRIHDDLTQSFIRYLTHHGFNLSDVEATAKLHIPGLPKPKSTQSIKEFMNDNKLLEDYQILHGIFIIMSSTSHAGRKMALGFLLYILANHEAGKCWCGKFEEIHFVISNNGNEFFIDLHAGEDLTQEGGIADLLKYCELILSLFKDENGKFPLYFDEFHTDCTRMPDPYNELVKWNRFLKLMRSPFALKAPSARSELLCNIYTLAFAKTVKGRPFMPLNNKRCLVEWRKDSMSLEPYQEVYSHGSDGLYDVNKWGCTYWYLLRFSWHFAQHVLKQCLQGNFDLHDINGIELMLSKQLEEFLANFIRYFIYELGLDDMFHSAWAVFEASDCNDKAKRQVFQGALKDNLQDGFELTPENNDAIAQLLFAVAAEATSIDLISLLIEAGGDPDACNDDGLTPIQVAASRNNRKAVEFLLTKTTPLSGVSNWSFDGIKEYMSSKAVVTQSQVKEVTSPDTASLARQQSASVSSSAKEASEEASSNGRNAYNKGDYIGAKSAYSQAIELDPTNATLLSNRSLCWLMLGIAQDALDDAKKCQLLSPNLGIAFYREGAALLELQRYFDAAIAFNKGANLEPDDPEYLRAFREAIKEGMKSKGKPKLVTTDRRRLNSLD